jgi:flagellar M-ring protein FliF
MIGTGVAAVLVLGGVIFLMLRKRSLGDARYAGSINGDTIAVSMESEVPVAEIGLEDKNEIKKKIEKFVGLKPETVAQLLKTWLNEE